MEVFTVDQQEPGVTYAPEQQFLYERALEILSKKPSAWFLEIGSFTGTTAKAFARAIKERGDRTNFLICIDPFYGHYDEGLTEILKKKGTWPSSWNQFNENLGDLIDFVIPISATTQKARNLLLQTFFPIELCFVDGEHTQEAATFDLDFCWSLGTKEIICHDASWESVNAAIVEFTERKGLTWTWELGDCFAKITT